jgi:23S rRNA pseudouridine2605 synthase
MADEDGIKDDHLTEAEVMAWMQARMAGGGAGRGPGGPGPGAGGGPGGPGPGARGPGAGGPGGGPAGMFSRWDADGDGMVTREEFEARPRGGPGAGGPGGGPGGPPSQ